MSGGLGAPVDGTAVLQRVPLGRITLTPLADGKGWGFDRPTRFDTFVTGVVVRGYLFWLR